MILPESFIERTKVLLGEDGCEALTRALSKSPSISVRANNKITLHPSNNLVPWCENGFYLQDRPIFTLDPLLHGGAFYVQEASSMFLHQVVKQHLLSAKRVLDLCAAPGGKSTLLLQSLAEDCLLISNEIIRSRANILSENITKWGNSNSIVTNNNPSDFGRLLPSYFDAVVVDAPCSGEGMFRKDLNAINEWSPQAVDICAKRQQEILSSVWETLKPGGVLVYSTCTFNKEENEENVEWICSKLGATTLAVDLKGNSDITLSDFGYRFYPHKTRGEGFFISVLKKNKSDEVQENSLNFKKNVKQRELKDTHVSKMLKNSKEWAFFESSDKIKAYNRSFLNDCLFFEQQFNCLSSGIVMGELKGKDFIPSQQLALSKEIDLKKIEKIELDYKSAILYLKKEAIYLPDAKKGFLLVCYKNLPLGWVKNVGNRCNNLYPQAWRIRMNID